MTEQQPHSPERLKEQLMNDRDAFAQQPKDVLNEDEGRRNENEGRSQLAENLARVIETGDVTTTKEYLDALLADMEEVFPVSERRAAFEFLAQEQRGEIRRGLYLAGINMVEVLGKNNRDVRKDAAQTGHSTQRSLEAATETFNSEVGRHLKGHVDTRKATYGHEVAEQSLRGVFRLFEAHAEVLEGWIKKQKQTVIVYSEQVDSGRSHEMALDQASVTLQPEYDGEPKDLSRAITEWVKIEVAHKLKDAVDTAKKAGLPPEEAVLAIISAEAEPIDMQPVDMLRSGAVMFVDEISYRNRRANLDRDDLLHVFRRFSRDGREGYSYASRPEEAVDVYRSQQRKIEQIVQGITKVIKLSEMLISASDDEHKRMQAIAEVMSQQVAA